MFKKIKSDIDQVYIFVGHTPYGVLWEVHQVPLGLPAAYIVQEEEPLTPALTLDSNLLWD